MKLRTLVLPMLIAVTLTACLFPTALAASSCSRSGSALQFSLSCGMSGTCTDPNLCILTVTCTATFLGVATGTCGGGAMICLLLVCEGQATLPVLGGASWSTSCSVSGVSVEAETLSCSVS